MSNKNLLQESEIRKMMKFANIGALSNGFVEKINEAGYYDEQEETDEMARPGGTGGVYEAEGEDEPVLDEPAMGDEPAMDDEPEDELALDNEPEGEPEGDVAAALEGVQTVLKAMQAGFREMGMDEAAEAIQVEMTAEPDAEDAAPMDDMPVMDDEPAMDMDMNPEGEAGEVGMPPSPDEEEPPMEEDLFNEVVRRVAKRLMNK
jgi:hypothetical protein